MNEVTARAEVEPAVTRLADPVKVTVRIEGPAPLRIDPPRMPLDEASAQIWRISPDAPATLTTLPDGRQRWTQSYRVDPFIPGEAVPLGFVAYPVYAGIRTSPEKVTPLGLTIRVTVDVTEAKVDHLRPLAELPELPAPPSSGSSHLPGYLGIGVVLVVILGLFAWWVRRRPRVLLDPQVELTRALAPLSEDPRPDPDWADDLARAVRRYVGRLAGLDPRPWTTEELLARVPAEAAEAVAGVLRNCDAARYAGAPISDRAALLDAARALATPPHRPGPPVSHE